MKDPNSSPAEDFIATELETYKTETKLVIEKNRAENIAENKDSTDNLLTGDNLKKVVEAFDRQISSIGDDLEIELPLVDLLLKLGKLSFLLRSTVVEPLQSLTFVSIRTSDGGINLKADVVGMFEALADCLDSMTENIRIDISNGIPLARIYSCQRPRGRTPMISKIKKNMRLLEKYFRTFSVEWDAAANS